MNHKVNITKKDIAVVLFCIIFLLTSLGAVSSGGRRRAKEAVCLSNLKQWGTIWAMYTDDNNGYFPRRTESSGRWITVLYDYYSKSPKICVCPMAKKMALEKPGSGSILAIGGDKFTSWGKVDIGRGAAAGIYGSYGCNGWVYVPGSNPLYGMSADDFWRTPNVKGASNVPLFLDAWFWDGWPLNGNNPPPGDGREYMGGGGDGDAMNRFCINRHQQAINGLFLDYTIRKIGLKELWRLKWHKTFNTNVTMTWPMWMRNFKDY
jgi:hypothetical protein